MTPPQRARQSRLRSDASARELGCTTAIAAMIVGGLLAYLVWEIVFNV